MRDLTTLGWSPQLAKQFEPYAGRGLVPGRVSREHTHIYGVYLTTAVTRPLGEDATSDDPTRGEALGPAETLARVTGRFRHEARHRQDFPAVGDWVALRPPAGGSSTDAPWHIHAVLPRHSKFSRKVAGAVSIEQVVAANVDTILIVSALDRDFNLKRLERYLVVGRESQATPVLVLNKADLCDDVPAAIAAARTIARDVTVHAVSCVDGAPHPSRGHGPDVLRCYLRPGETVALLGSSGVGKSTLINRLLGEERQRTHDVRESDRRGRHTTTHRELIPMPGGALMIDTPGMRELQLWETDTGLGETFEDIEALSAQCRFRDCGHQDEPDCAVKAAVDGGTLSAEHLQSYQKLKAELAAIDARRATDVTRKAASGKRPIVRSTRIRPQE